MIGESEAINHIKLMIDKVAQTEARVLITGPSGTRKELVAHQLHEKSQRANFPLIEVNCAAIPSELIESVLFGHVKGAFTSAITDRAGKFEAADKGTIFLDEIGDLDASSQVKGKKSQARIYPCFFPGKINKCNRVQTLGSYSNNGRCHCTISWNENEVH